MISKKTGRGQVSSEIIKAARDAPPPRRSVAPYDFRPKRAVPPDKRRVPRQKPIRMARDKRRRALVRLTAFIASFVIIVLVGVYLAVYFTRDNALAVYIDERLFGHMVFDENIETGFLLAEAQRLLEARVTAIVIVNETLELRSARARETLSATEMVSAISEELTYKIVGVEFFVNGVSRGILRHEGYANEIIFQLQAPFLSPDVDYKVIEFVDAVETRPVLVEESALMPMEYLMRELLVNVSTMQEYIVQDGDTLERIALMFGVPLQRIQADNPEVEESHFIRINDILRISAEAPLISVRTIEEITRRVNIPITTIEEENPEAFVGSRIELSEGAEGEEERIIHVTRVNGIALGEEIIHTRIIRAAEPRVISIGTREITPIRQ